MSEKRDSKERRKHVRFDVREGAFVAVFPEMDIMGPILNISKGGLAFRHNGAGEQKNESFEMDILFLRHGYQVKRVPSKMVAHFDVTNNIHPNSLHAKHCCVQFGELTEFQAAHLENFIQLYGA